MNQGHAWNRALLSVATFAGLLVPWQPVMADAAKAKDQTGVPWVLPFKDAQAKADKEHRLLFIKPIAFGTSADGGW